MARGTFCMLIYASFSPEKSAFHSGLAPPTGRSKENPRLRGRGFLARSKVSWLLMAKGGNWVREIVLALGHEPGTTKNWLTAEKAISRVLVVRNGKAEGMRP